MAGSSHRPLVAVAAIGLFAVLLFGCAKGSGEGTVTGEVWAPDCDLEATPYDLNPTFFAMQPSTSVEIIDIVVQRGSDLKNFSDGISLFIREPELVRDTMLGMDLDFGGVEAPVEMTLYLNDTCPGIARLPVVYEAVSGSIRFDALYVPWLDDNDTRETSAVFTDVELVDRREPDERRAIVSGDFSFLYERGRPPQFF